MEGALEAKRKELRLARLAQVREAEARQAAITRNKYRSKALQLATEAVGEVRSNWEEERQFESSGLQSQLDELQSLMGQGQREAQAVATSRYEDRYRQWRERQEAEDRRLERGDCAVMTVWERIRANEERAEERKEWQRRAREQADEMRRALALSMERHAASLPRSVANPFGGRNAPRDKENERVGREAAQAALAASATGPGPVKPPVGLQVVRNPHHRVFAAEWAQRDAESRARLAEADHAVVDGARLRRESAKEIPAPELPPPLRSAFDEAEEAAVRARGAAEDQRKKDERRTDLREMRGEAAMSQVAEMRSGAEVERALDRMQLLERRKALARTARRELAKARELRAAKAAVEEVEEVLIERGFEDNVPEVVGSAAYPPPPDHPTFLPRNDRNMFEKGHPARRKAAAALEAAIRKHLERQADEDELEEQKHRDLHEEDEHGVAPLPEWAAPFDEARSRLEEEQRALEAEHNASRGLGDVEAEDEEPAGGATAATSTTRMPPPPGDHDAGAAAADQPHGAPVIRPAAPRVTMSPSQSSASSSPLSKRAKQSSSSGPRQVESMRAGVQQEVLDTLKRVDRLLQDAAAYRWTGVASQGPEARGQEALPRPAVLDEDEDDKRVGDELARQWRETRDASSSAGQGRGGVASKMGVDTDEGADEHAYDSDLVDRLLGVPAERFGQALEEAVSSHPPASAARAAAAAAAPAPAVAAAARAPAAPAHATVSNDDGGTAAKGKHHASSSAAAAAATAAADDDDEFEARGEQEEPHSPVLDAAQAVRDHPRKAPMSFVEMRLRTERNYERLPEVRQQAEKHIKKAELSERSQRAREFNDNLRARNSALIRRQVALAPFKRGGPIPPARKGDGKWH